MIIEQIRKELLFLPFSESSEIELSWLTEERSILRKPKTIQESASQLKSKSKEPNSSKFDEVKLKIKRYKLIRKS
jgi:hypothetical protein